MDEARIWATPAVATHVQQILHKLAQHELALAASEAATVPYWIPCPDSVAGHRIAARSLLDEAKTLMTVSPVEPGTDPSGSVQLG